MMENSNRWEKISGSLVVEEVVTLGDRRTSNAYSLRIRVPETSTERRDGMMRA
jgi:hypothetical protein